MNNYFKIGMMFTFGCITAKSVDGIVRDLILHKVANNEDLMVYLMKNNNYLYHKVKKYA